MAEPGCCGIPFPLGDGHPRWFKRWLDPAATGFFPTGPHHSPAAGTLVRGNVSQVRLRDEGAIFFREWADSRKGMQHARKACEE